VWNQKNRDYAVATSSCASRTQSLVKDYSSKPTSFETRRAAVEEASANNRRQMTGVQRSEVKVKPSDGVMHTVQFGERMSRCAAVDNSCASRIKARQAPTSMIVMNEAPRERNSADNRIRQKYCSNRDERYDHSSDGETKSDEEPASRRRRNFHKQYYSDRRYADNSAVSSRGRMKQFKREERDSSKENYSSSSDRKCNPRRREQDSRRDDYNSNDGRRQKKRT